MLFSNVTFYKLYNFINFKKKLKNDANVVTHR